MPCAQRHLPHLYELDQPLFVTFRLQGSLPPGREFPASSTNSGRSFATMDRLLDTHRESPKFLQMPKIASCVSEAIQKGVGNYHLHAWVIMPNHVHLLIAPKTQLSKLMHKLKGSTARQANQILGRTGVSFWQEESYDHLVRNSTEFERIENYIHQNPVRAGLVNKPEDFRWSSAWTVGRDSSRKGLQPRSLIEPFDVQSGLKPAAE